MMNNLDLWAKDTPLLLDGKRHDPPFPIRYYYNQYDAKKEMHSMEFIFYCRTGSAKWRQTTQWHSNNTMTRFTAVKSNGGENDK